MNLGLGIIKLNAKFLFKYPKYYIKSYLNLMSLTWEITTPEKGYTSMQPLVRLRSVFVRTTFADGFVERVTNITASNMFNPFIWRGGLPLFMLILVALKLILKKKKVFLLAFLPIFLTTAALLLSMPDQDSRYILPITLCSAFFDVFALAILQKDSERLAV